jgi:hypothetical protein
MLASTLSDLLKPFEVASKVRSLDPRHSKLMLDKQGLHYESLKTVIHAWAPLGVKDPVGVDVYAFLELFRNKNPGNEEISFLVEGTKMEWSYGKVYGRIVVSPPHEIPLAPEVPEKDFVPASPELGRALDLGGSSNSNIALRTVGLYGVQILSTKTETWCLSSDNRTISAAILPLYLKQARQPISVGPEELEFLVYLCSRGGRLAFLPSAILYEDQGISALIKLKEPIQHDLLGIVNRYRTQPKKIVPLDKEVVQTFVRKVSHLSTLKYRTPVDLYVAEGKVLLAFEDERLSVEEFYEVTKERIESDVEFHVTICSASFGSSGTPGQAIAACDEMIADYADQKVLVFRSADDAFYYLTAAYIGD